VRRLLALMVVCCLFAACTGSTTTAVPPTVDRTSPAVGATESAPTGPVHAARIPLPHLPPQGFVVEWRHADGRPGARVVLMNLRGNVIVGLTGFSIDHVSDRPGVVFLRRGPDEYILRIHRSSLRSVAKSRVSRLRRGDDSNIPLGVPPNAPRQEGAGLWRWMDLAPNGNVALAQWSGECDFPIAFVVPVQEGHAIPVTGAATLGRTPASIGLGWTERGHIAVILPSGACGAGSNRPGVYRFTSPGQGRLIFAIEEASAVRMWGPSSAPSQPWS
jgi:hypothetical protein